MKRFLMIIVMLAITNSLFSQIDSTKVPFISYWSIGDSYDFKISKIEKRWKEGALTKDQKHHYIANFTVIDSTENSYSIKWSIENYLLNSNTIPEKHLDKLSRYQIIEAEYKTSEVGEFIELLNWKEVTEFINNMFDDLKNIVGAEEVLKNKMFPLQQVYSSKEGLELFILNELQFFHFPFGYEFDITEPFYYDDEFPNILGGKPIKANTKLDFEYVNFDESFCVIKQETSLNPENTKEIIIEALKKMNLDEKDFENDLKLASFEINDRVLYEYYFYPGIPHKIESTRENIISIGKVNGKRIDKIIIELLYDN